MKQIGKQGKAVTATTAGLFIVGIIAIIAILALIGVIPTKSGSLSVTGTSNQNQANGANGLSCAYAPSLAVTGTDAIVSSTTATPTTVNYIVNSNYVGTSAPTAVAGDKYVTVNDLAGYLAVKDEFTLACGANNRAEKLYKYANATVTIKDDVRVSSNTLSNGGGVYNATKAAAGASRIFPVLFDGTNQRSTSSIQWIVETPANTGVNTSSITASCDGVPLATKAIPAGIAAANAGSTRASFIVPALINTQSHDCKLYIQNTASGVVLGTLLNTFYAEQTFVDADGHVQVGIMDESPNGNNAAKYQDSYTYNIVIA